MVFKFKLGYHVLGIFTKYCREYCLFIAYNVHVYVYKPLNIHNHKFNVQRPDSNTFHQNLIK